MPSLPSVKISSKNKFSRKVNGNEIALLDHLVLKQAHVLESRSTRTRTRFQSPARSSPLERVTPS